VSGQDSKKDSAFAGFKEFVLRGNVLDLAVAVVVGAAFTAIVNSIVTNVFNPAIGALFNAESLSKTFVWSIPTMSGGTAKIAFGGVLAAILQFLIVALVVYFVLVLPLNRLKRIAFAKQQKAESEADAAPLPPSEAELLLQIRDLLAAQADQDVVPSATGKHAVIPDGITPSGGEGTPMHSLNGVPLHGHSSSAVHPRNSTPVHSQSGPRAH
jgi:large conductance mechanosensitive channel